MQLLLQQQQGVSLSRQCSRQLPSQTGEHLCLLRRLVLRQQLPLRAVCKHMPLLLPTQPLARLPHQIHPLLHTQQAGLLPAPAASSKLQQLTVLMHQGG